MKSYKGYNQIFRANLHSPATVAKGGGVVTGTPEINDGVFGVGSAAGVYVNFDRDFSWFWENGGSVRIRFNLHTGAGSFERTFFYGLDAEHQLVIALHSTNASSIIELRNGSGNTYYNANQPVVSLNEVQEIVLTWDKTTFTSYVEGGNAVADSNIGSQQLGSYPTNYKSVRFGGLIAGALECDFFDCEFYKNIFTAEEVKDLYEQDTVQELEQPLIDLPLRSSYYKATGVELLVDGDMEAIGITDWKVGSGATVTKETGTRTGGSGAQVLRISGASGVFAYPAVAAFTAGTKVRIKLWARGDGSAYPAVENNSATNTIWVGSSSTGWQEIDIIWTVVGGTDLILRKYGTGYVEYDDVSVELMENLTENKGTLGGTAKMGDGLTATMPTLLSPKGNKTDGGDFLTLGTSPVTNTNEAFTVGGLFTLVAGAYHPIISASAGADAGYELRVENGTVLFYLWSSAGNWIGAYAGGGAYTNGKHVILATYDGSLANTGIEIYIDGKKTSPTRISSGSFASASISNTLYVGRNKQTNYAGNGIEWRDILFDNKVYTPTQVRVETDKIRKMLNI